MEASIRCWFLFLKMKYSNLFCNNTTNSAEQGIWHEIHPPWGKICRRWKQEPSLLADDSSIHKFCAVDKFPCLQNLLRHTKFLSKATHLTTYCRCLQLPLMLFSAKRNRDAAGSKQKNKQRDQKSSASTKEDKIPGLRPMGGEDNTQKIKKHKWRREKKGRGGRKWPQTTWRKNKVQKIGDSHNPRNCWIAWETNWLACHQRAQREEVSWLGQEMQSWDRKEIIKKEKKKSFFT